MSTIESQKDNKVVKKKSIAPIADQTATAIIAIGEELTRVKNLLVLLLMKGGSSQEEIARALGVDQSTVSRRFKIGDVEPFLTRGQNEAQR